MGKTLRIACLALVVAVAGATPALAQDAPAGWAGSAEATFVNASGNASSSTLGFVVNLGRDLSGGTFKIEAGGIRAESSTITRFAVGSIDNFDVQKDSVSTLTAESFFVRGRFDRPVNEQVYWFAGAGWDRNTFAGVQNRYSAAAGVGRTWFESDASHFKTDLGVTYTSEEPVGGFDTATFAGLRFSWDYGRQLSGNTGFASVLVVDENLSDTSDLRASFVNSLSVAMSERFSLKTSLQLLWDNQPALAPILLAGTEALVLAPFDKLDKLLTVALVVNF